MWTVTSLICKQQKIVCEFILSEYFFSESDFGTITPHFFNPISKMFCNFSLQLNMAKRRHVFFLALSVRKLRSKLNKRKTKFALTCSFQKVIRISFQNSWYSLINLSSFFFFFFFFTQKMLINMPIFSFTSKTPNFLFHFVLS